MNNLTINFTVENVAEFLEKNLKEIKKASKMLEVKVQICAKADLEQIKENKYISYFKSSGNEYEDYCAFLEKTDTEYVIFYNEQNIFCSNMIEKMLKQLQNYNDIAFVQPVHKGMPLEVKKADNIKYSKEKWLDFSEKKKSAKLLYFNRYVFNTNFLRKIEFTEVQKLFYKDRILLSMLEESDGLKILNDMTVYTEEPLENNINLYYEQFRKEWYVEYFKEFIIPYIKTSSMNAQIQQMIMYFIELRFYFNLNGRDKFVLEGNDIDEYFAIVKEVLQFIDDEYIVELRQIGCLPKIFAYLFMKMKYEDVLITTEKTGKNVSYFVNGLWLDKDCVGVAIKAINFQNQELRIDCEVKGSFMIPHIEKKLKVLVNRQEVEFEQTKVYNITKAFGRSICRYNTFQLVLPENMMDKKLEIKFKLEQKKMSFELPILFESTSARLIASRASYFEFGDHMICPVRNKLVVKKTSKALICVKEFFILFKMLKMRKN